MPHCLAEEFVSVMLLLGAICQIKTKSKSPKKKQTKIYEIVFVFLFVERREGETVLGKYSCFWGCLRACFFFFVEAKL